MTLRAFTHRTVTVFLAVVSAVACRSASRDPPAPIVQPGAPGEPGRVITPEAAADLSQLRYTAAEVQFVQRMLVHHATAVNAIDRSRLRALAETVRGISAARRAAR